MVANRLSLSQIRAYGKARSESDPEARFFHQVDTANKFDLTITFYWHELQSGEPIRDDEVAMTEKLRSLAEYRDVGDIIEYDDRNMLIIECQRRGRDDALIGLGLVDATTIDIDS